MTKNQHYNEGTGIGLALTKELVELMGGQINVRSMVNKGSTFSIKLPVQKNPEIKTNNISFEKSSSPLSDESYLPISDPLVSNIDIPVLLIIEDSVDIVNYLKISLGDKFQILVSYNGKDGLEKAIETIPDIIITDIMMPGLNGLEVCDLLKNDERTNHIPVIMLTAKVQINDRIEGLSRGADAYLSKPFEIKELLVRLDKLLILRRTLQNKYLLELKSNYEKNKTKKKPKNSFIHKIESEILSNLSNENFSVNELTKLVFLSRSQLNRKIKAYTGMSTSLFIRHIRLLQAKKLLQNSDLSVSEVLYKVGFNSPAYFTQAYKNQFGHTPSEANKL